MRAAWISPGASASARARTRCARSAKSLSEARKLGAAQALEAAGVGILEGICFYVLERLSEIRRENGWVNLVSNSAKIVNTITAHRFNTILRRTAECVEIACSGRLA